MWDETELVHSHPLGRVFSSAAPPSRLSNQLLALKVKMKTKHLFLFCLSNGYQRWGEHRFIISSISVWGKGLSVWRADVHVFGVSELLWELCLGLKRWWTTTWKASKLCSGPFQWKNIHFILCVCVCVRNSCMCVWGQPAGKCLMKLRIKWPKTAAVLHPSPVTPVQTQTVPANPGQQ